jgi:transposase
MPDISLVLALLQAAMQLIPEREAALPVVEKLVMGNTLAISDVNTLNNVIQALNDKLALTTAPATVSDVPPPVSTVAVQESK